MPELAHAQGAEDHHDKNDDGAGPDKSGDDVLAFAY
jgi:cytochrome d ubiquinol oxidase subunit I